MSRLSLDFETSAIIDAERLLHPKPPPELSDAEAAPVRVKDEHRDFILALMHSTDPESMTAVLKEATQHGETAELALMLLKLNSDGLWATFQRLRGAEPKEITELTGVTRATSHGRVKSILARLPSHVREVIHPHVLRPHIMKNLDD
jgi:hypothetical protein